MKRKGLAILLALGLLGLTACGGSAQSEETTAETTAAVTETPDIHVESEITPTEPPEIAGGRLLVAEAGTYSGLYPEDGSDEAVTDVAALLVMNVSDQACQFCTLEYTVDGETALFNISELPAGKGAWVLEANGLTCGNTAKFEFVNDTSVFRDADAQWVPGITVIYGQGEMTVTNESDTAYSLLTIYYKLSYAENTYLGGITYRTTVDGLAPGETKTLTSGHFYEGAAELVGIYTDGAPAE